METQEAKKLLRSSWLVCCFKGFPVSSSSSKKEYRDAEDEEKQTSPPEGKITKQRKPGGWKAMPYVLGNESFERLAGVGLMANFMMFLMTQFHLDQVSASNVLSVWSGSTSFLPLLGAFLCDAYLGRFLTLSFATVSSFLGMVTLTLIPWLPTLHPPSCDFLVHPETCKGPTSSQMGVLTLALGFLSIGSAGIRPCNIPFGVDQFDPTTEEGRKGINSFFNWYYMSFTVIVIIALTLVVYIQTSVSWVLGFAIPSVLMFCGIILFFLGTRIYIYVKPEGSVFTDLVQSLVAAYKKRKLEFPVGEEIEGAYYDPPLTGATLRKIPLSNDYRFLNKAAIIQEGELNPDGSRAEKWRLSSIQRIEEVKCIFRIVPVWAAGIICFTVIGQQGTFTLSQALKMDRHIGPKFQIPPGSLSIISMITIGIFLPLYDRIFAPLLRKRTKIEGGITLLQRIGIGLGFSILSMVVAALVEVKRRHSALAHAGPDGIAPISVMWLAPQLILMGLCEAMNAIGQIEFYNKEFPESMISVANSVFSISGAGANYLSIIVVNVVHKTTAKNGHPDWLTKNINQGRLENFYYILAGMGVLNLVYFMAIAPRYKYKSRVWVDEEERRSNIELNGTKH